MRIILLVPFLIMVFLSPDSVDAEARYFKPGETLDADIWYEDAQINPVKYFVKTPLILAPSKKCSTRIDENATIEFIEKFNELVKEDVFDDLDVRLVWSIRRCLSNAEMFEELGVSRNTYFFRLNKIRVHMRGSYFLR